MGLCHSTYLWGQFEIVIQCFPCGLNDLCSSLELWFSYGRGWNVFYLCCFLWTYCLCLFFFLHQFLVLDEADRVLDVGFEEELRVVFQCLPKNRQTLLFSATMTDNLQTLLELSANKAYFYEAYEGFKTVDTLKQQYLLVPKDVKDVYLVHILSKMEEMGIRSAMIFVSTCRYSSF